MGLPYSTQFHSWPRSCIEPANAASMPEVPTFMRQAKRFAAPPGLVDDGEGHLIVQPEGRATSLLAQDINPPHQYMFSNA